jgi:hypothetical protein
VRKCWSKEGILSKEILKELLHEEEKNEKGRERKRERELRSENRCLINSNRFPVILSNTIVLSMKNRLA